MFVFLPFAFYWLPHPTPRKNKKYFAGKCYFFQPEQQNNFDAGGNFVQQPNKMQKRHVFKRK